MCVLYVSFGSKVRSRTFECIAMGIAVLFILSSRFLLNSAGSVVSRLQVVLSGFSVRLFCFVQTKPFCMYGCMYFLAVVVVLPSPLTLVCVGSQIIQVLVQQPAYLSITPSGYVHKSRGDSVGVCGCS